MEKRRMLILIALLIFTAGISSAQLHENVEQVERFCNYWYSAEAFEISGRYVYIAAGVSGLQILEIRDKLHPVWAGAMEDIPYYAKGIAVEGNYVYLADIRGGLVIIDVSDPLDPVELNTFELPADVFLNDVDVKDGMAYLSTIEDGLRIVDVSDPLVPVEVGIIEGRWYNGVDFCGDYAFAICENAMNILDISVLPDLPLINSVRLLPITESITIFKDHAFLAEGGRGLRILDISDPKAVREESLTRIDGYVNKVDVSNNRALLACGNGASVLLDVTDYEEPKVMAVYGAELWMTEAKILGHYGYLLEGQSMHILNLNDTHELSLIREVGDRGRIKSAGVSGDYAYIASGDAGLQVMNLDPPVGEAEIPSLYGDAFVNRVVVEDGMAYVLGNGIDLRVLDLTVPVSPLEMGVCGDVGGEGNMTVCDGMVYIADEDNGLLIVDATDPVNPRLVGECEPEFNGWDSDVAISGDYAIMASANDGIRIIDVSNPQRSEQVGDPLDTGGSATGIATDGEIAYVACGSFGLVTVNIIVPNEPILLDRLATPGSARDVVINGDLAYVADYDGGVRVVDISDPADLVEVGFYITPGVADEVVNWGDRVIVADNSNLSIYEFVPAEERVMRLVAPLSVEGKNEKAEILAFNGVYPNPFNSIARVSYNLPAAMPVRLAVIDLAGRTVDLLEDGIVSAGSYSIPVDAQNLTSGIYLVRLTTPDRSFTQRVSVIK